MNILIKGMRMPKRCDECRLMVFEDTNCVSELYCGCPIVFKAIPQGKDNRPDYCPLIELPPHGRLIDADELIAKQQEDADLFINPYTLMEKSRRDEALNAVANIVNAPTIIEAEEVYDEYTDTAGNLHWTGTQSGEHKIPLVRQIGGVSDDD